MILHTCEFELNERTETFFSLSHSLSLCLPVTYAPKYTGTVKVIGCLCKQYTDVRVKEYDSVGIRELH